MSCHLNQLPNSEAIRSRRTITSTVDQHLQVKDHMLSSPILKMSYIDRLARGNATQRG